MRLKSSSDLDRVTTMSKQNLVSLLRDVRACRLCEEHLAHGVRPVLQAHSKARILIAGQAPGRRVHELGVPFDDPSGDRLREWLGVSRDAFYDATKIAILPMGFCYPGTGKFGDLPSRPECADTWREALFERLTEVKVTIVMGQYAMGWHLRQPKKSLTDTVLAWKDHRPARIPLPHPSPRNNIWLKKNPWFATQVLPYLKRRIGKLLS
jgi:uracil-DNA glycosylase